MMNPAEPDKQTRGRRGPDNTRRLFLAGGAVALTGAAGAVATASPAAAAPPADAPGQKKRLSVTEGPISPLDREFGWDDRPGADNTRAVQGAIDKAMTAPGGEVSLPAGEIRVTGLAVDYTGYPV
jgi:hypothetical protein